MAQNNSFKFTMAPTIVHTHNFALAYERKLSDQFAAGLKVNYGANDILPYNDDYALGFLVGLLDLEQGTAVGQKLIFDLLELILIFDFFHGKML
jgi:hypothetical protein